MVTVFHYTPVNAKQFDGLNIDGLAVKRQNFPPSKFCAIQYTHARVEKLYVHHMCIILYWALTYIRTSN